MRIAFTAAAAVSLALALPAAATLHEGVKAPDFTTTGAIAGKPFRLHLDRQLKHGPVILYFFPAAFTNGCNAEAKAFAEAIPQFEAEHAQVIGMSADPLPQLEKFSTAHCAGKFPVATASPKTIAAYDVALGKAVDTPDGGHHPITNRTSYVIAPDGTILFVHSDMSPVDHVRDTLEAVRNWRKDHPIKS